MSQSAGPQLTASKVAELRRAVGLTADAPTRADHKRWSQCENGDHTRCRHAREQR